MKSINRNSLKKSEKKDGKVSFNLTVGRRGEFIIGPKGKALKDFFEK